MRISRKAIHLLIGVLALSPIMIACNNNDSANSPHEANNPVNVAVESTLLFEGETSFESPNSNLNPNPLNSYNTDETSIVVKNQTDYQKLWESYQLKQNGQVIPMPVVDFSQGQVVFIDLGSTKIPVKSNTASFDTAKKHDQQVTVTATQTIEPFPPGTMFIPEDTFYTHPIVVIYIKSLLPINLNINKPIFVDSTRLSVLNDDPLPNIDAIASQMIITTKEALTKAAEAKLGSPLPIEVTNVISSLDFQKGQVVLLDRGGFSIGVHGLQYQNIINFKENIFKGYYWDYSDKNKNCTTPQSSINPYKFVWIPTTTKIEISTTSEIYTFDCL